MWGNFFVSTLDNVDTWEWSSPGQKEKINRDHLSYRFLSGVGVCGEQKQTGDRDYGLEMVETESIYCIIEGTGLRQCRR